jgi:[NiFe] hydrogenase diaphorase moiety large subunit
MASDEDARTKVDRILQRNGNDPTRLLSLLRDIQAEFHQIPAPIPTFLAAKLGLCPTQVRAVCEFYGFLSLDSRGTFDLRISDSITDHLLGSREVANHLCQQLGLLPGETRSDGRVSINFTSCTGMCDQGPAALVNGHALTNLSRMRVDRIIELIEQNVPLAEWPRELFAVRNTIHRRDRLLRRPVPSGAALKWSLLRGRESTFAELEKSGLRGRGGAGFPTAWKWRFCHQTAEKLAVCPAVQPAANVERYVICNADEGEPGTFKDRVLLDEHANQVFEGMTLCALLIGARKGLVYLRGEYLYLYERLLRVLDARRRDGLLGDKILGRPDFDFDIEIRLGAGAYICGEESALIESLEGKRGIPRNRPPYPVSHGYLGKPTVVNNVETFFAAAAIALYGGAWFAAVGTEKSKGTKLLSISGDCDRPGIYEYPFGVAVDRILQDCGAHDPFAVQVGGPSGTFISASEFDRKIAFEDLPTGGSFMVFDHTRDVLAIARNFTHFFAEESCGFCTPCRVGTTLLKNLLDKICDGHGTMGDLAELTRLSRLVRSASHCGLGQTAANPILHTLERFPERYQRRLKAIRFEPGFDVDGALAVAREMTGREDAGAHLSQNTDEGMA